MNKIKKTLLRKSFKKACELLDRINENPKKYLKSKK